MIRRSILMNASHIKRMWLQPPGTGSSIDTGNLQTALRATKIFLQGFKSIFYTCMLNSYKLPTFILYNHTLNRNSVDSVKNSVTSKHQHALIKCKLIIIKGWVSKGPLQFFIFSFPTKVHLFCCSSCLWIQLVCIYKTVPAK